MKVWSVELEANMWNDDTFTETFEEFVKYCKANGYKINGQEVRISEIDSEDGFCYNMVYGAVYCDAADCINCERFDCILHPGDGDD